MNERNRASERVSESNAAPIATASLLDAPTADRSGVTLLLRAFVEAIKGGALIVSGLLSLVLLSGVLAVASRRRTLTVALLLAIPAVAGRWLNIFSRTCASASDISCRRNRLSCFCHREFAALCSARPFGRRRILCVSISAYLMLGLIWTMAYWLVEQLTPGAFAFNTATGTKETMEGFNAFYFSFITLSTVGYGDITPVSKVARMLAATEAMTGLLYVAVLIARLVGLYSTTKSS